jgi:hypothetical protein
MAEFNIQGKISFDIDFDINADTEQEAIQKATELLKDYYHLNVSNAFHENEKIEVDAAEIEYED